MLIPVMVHHANLGAGHEGLRDDGPLDYETRSHQSRCPVVPSSRGPSPVVRALAVSCSFPVVRGCVCETAADLAGQSWSQPVSVSQIGFLLPNTEQNGRTQQNTPKNMFFLVGAFPRQPAAVKNPAYSNQIRVNPSKSDHRKISISVRRPPTFRSHGPVVRGLSFAHCAPLRPGISGFLLPGFQLCVLCASAFVRSFYQTNPFHNTRKRLEIRRLLLVTDLALETKVDIGYTPWGLPLKIFGGYLDHKGAVLIETENMLNCKCGSQNMPPVAGRLCIRAHCC